MMHQFTTKGAPSTALGTSISCATDVRTAFIYKPVSHQKLLAESSRVPDTLTVSS